MALKALKTTQFKPPIRKCREIRVFLCFSTDTLFAEIDLRECLKERKTKHSSPLFGKLKKL